MKKILYQLMIAAMLMHVSIISQAQTIKDSKYKQKYSGYQAPVQKNHTEENHTEVIGGYGDNDGDGHRNTNAGGDDCDDNDRNRFPGNAEMNDSLGHDEDCDINTIGRFDNSDTDLDHDGFLTDKAFNKANGVNGTVYFRGNDCNDNDASIIPGSLLYIDSNNARICGGNIIKPDPNSIFYPQPNGTAIQIPR